jgi:hypothetical protein
MAEFRFLRGSESYKYRFAEDDPGVVTVACARGVRASATLRAWKARRDMHYRMAPRLKRAFRMFLRR